MPLEPRIVYQDTDLLVIDKPFGLPAQGTLEPKQPHVFGILSAQFSYIGLHHRLDTPASVPIMVTGARGLSLNCRRAN